MRDSIYTCTPYIILLHAVQYVFIRVDAHRGNSEKTRASCHARNCVEFANDKRQGCVRNIRREGEIMGLAGS